MREGIVKEITDIVMDRVKTQNMDVVFDKSGMSLNGVPLVMYSRDNYDFTNDVIASLNNPGRVSPETKTTESTSATSPAARTPSLGGATTRTSPVSTATPRKP